MEIVICKGQFMGPISGADETVTTYATQLRAAGHAPSVLLMYPHERDDQYYLRLKRANVPVISIASTPVRASLGVGRKMALGLTQTFPPLQRLIRRHAHRITTNLTDRYLRPCLEYFERRRPDVVHVVTPDPSAMVMIRAAHHAGVPVVYQELGMPYHPPAFAAYYRRFTSVLPLCAEVAALSPALMRLCRESLPAAVGPALCVLPIMAEDLPGERQFETTAPDATVVTFGFAARIELLKGSQVLTDAFARVAAAATTRASDVRLRIAGAGSQKHRIEQQLFGAGLAERCFFSGLYTDGARKSAFMSGLDVFVLPSFTEGTPNSIIEAMSHGVPIIASAVGGIPDMLTPETGILVPAGDADALARAMLRLAADRALCARMGRAARQRYEKVFSPPAVLPVMLDAYERIAAAKKALAPAARERVVARVANVHPWLNLKQAEARP